MSVHPLSSKVIACAFEVHTVLGSGFLEGVYLEALYQELTGVGITCEKEKKISISYKGRLVGQYRADLVVADSIVIETKCVEKIAMRHIYQVKNYLRGIDRQYGMVINFGGTAVSFRHVFV